MKSATPSTLSPEAIAADCGCTVAEVRAAIDDLKMSPALTRTTQRFSETQAAAIIAALGRRQASTTANPIATIAARPHMVNRRQGLALAKKGINQ